MPGIAPEPRDADRRRLALILHFHQPVGNFDDVVRRVAERCYRPLLELLAEFPSIKTHLHFNGILLNWFERHEPELLQIIQRLVAAGSAELLTGGHQEPILAVIPAADAIEQTKQLTAELQARFHTHAAGAWLTERVWEPNLPTLLHQAGVRYVSLDDTILKASGADPARDGVSFSTDDRGNTLIIFSADHRLRYAIPFRPHDEALALMGPGLSVYADDAEKFGEWPQTHEWVYEKGWLRTFFTRLQAEIETVHLTDELSAPHSLPRVYPPSSSYPEMMVWALPTDARIRLERLLANSTSESPWREFVGGAPWRGFFAKYPEAHRLYCRMLRVSARLHQQQFADAAARARIERDLFAGQCNDAYWHGSFGGLYLVHLRRSVERHLIRAERALDRLQHDLPTVRPTDIDFDGKDEIEINAPGVSAGIDPARGGALIWWDLRSGCTNLVSTMQRHEEPFHRQLAEADATPHELPTDGNSISTIHGPLRLKRALSDEDLRFDRHSRLAGSIWRAPLGANWQAPLDLEREARHLDGNWTTRIEADRVTLQLEDDGVRIEKSYRFDPQEGSLHFEVAVEGSTQPWLLWTEWNLLLGHTGEDLRRADGGDNESARGHAEQVHRFAWVAGSECGLELVATPQAMLAWDVIRTVSSSESGLERNAQGNCWIVGWKVGLGRWQASLMLRPTVPPLADGDPL